MARRNDHTRDELKALILDKAWNIIGKKGFEGLTMRVLATQIGYAPGTIYNIFKSMDDLVLNVNVRTLDLLYAELSNPACLNPANAPSDNMKLMARRYMAFTRTYHPHWLLLFNRALPEKRKSLGWYQEKIDRLFTPLESLLTPYFAAHDRQKIVAARVLWSSVHGLCFLQETGKISVVNNHGSAEDMADYLINTFMRGIEK